MKISFPSGTTLIDQDTIELLIPNLTTQQELNEFEAANITQAILWASKSKSLRSEILSVSQIRLLHEKMFNETWQWAGKFRHRETNIGIDPSQIQNHLGTLIGDVKYWLEQKTFPLDEIAIRLHHRLAKIHPFPNGNGRHARLIADLLVEFNGGIKFSWGISSLAESNKNREEYISHLKFADKTDNVSGLLVFARS